MKPLPILALLAVAGCQSTQIADALKTPGGELFCRIQTAGGGSFVAALTATAATAAAPGGAPLYVIATNAGKAAVDADCAKAAATVPGGVAGQAVSPPADPATARQVMIVAPASPVAASASVKGP